MFEYQENNRYFAQSGKFLEDVLKDELQELGATKCSVGKRGVYFTAAKEVLYKINYTCTTAFRVLAPIFSFQCENGDNLYNEALNIQWDKFITINHTFAIFSNVHNNPNFVHSNYASLKLKDAIADSFRNKYKKRPNVDPKNPDIWFNLNINKNNAIISVDTSGGSLHRRGYRIESTEAPIQETLAAAILRLSKWNGEVPLIDPMCGSGTFLAEAYMKYCRIPTGIFRRKFGFFFLPDFDKNVWDNVKKDTLAKIRPYKNGLIKGTDIDRKVVNTAKSNISKIPGGENIKIDRWDFRELDKIENSLIVTNPPYAVRLNEREETEILYSEFGDFLKTNCKGTNAWILCGDVELLRKIQLKVEKKYKIFNGGIEAQLANIKIF